MDTQEGGEVARTLWPHVHGWLITPPGEPLTFERDEEGMWMASDGSIAKADVDGLIHLRVYSTQKVKLTIEMTTDED